jgi:hypothetical protein
VTDYPLIEQQDNLACPGLWDEFLTSDEEYDHTVDLTVPNGPETQFMWSIVNGAIKARLVHNNVFGWLAMGFADPDGGHNGMNGGQILLATPYGTDDYSPVTGLDTSSEDAMIATYVIDSEDTAFRHWQNPIDSEEALATVASFETNDCATLISFESSHINGKEFNINGTDEMIWAGNSNDYFVGYHGPFSRMRFTVDWKSGDVVPFAISQEDGSHIESTATYSETTQIADIVSELANNGEASDVNDVKDSGSGAVCNNGKFFVVSALAASIGMFVWI